MKAMLTDEDRLIELESKLSFAEDLIDELNRAFYRQQEQLDLMQQQIKLLHQQIEAVTPETARDLRAEIPPHY
jgi:SlyX protein